jgi:prepilin-type N-terminal cleavage/methylation domain-containing protein
MGTPPPSRPRPRRSAFTLIEMVVVIGIIGILMAMGIPGIVSQIKRADLYNTTNIISTLHSFSVQNARTFTAATPPTAVYQLTVKQDKILFLKDGAAIPSYEIGKQFSFTTEGGINGVTFEDSFKPDSYIIYSGGPAWSTAATTVASGSWSDLVIKYQARTGFVQNDSGAISKIVLIVKDAKGKKFAITFQPTGALNVASA